jgi:hypothetical protein
MRPNSPLVTASLPRSAVTLALAAIALASSATDQDAAQRYIEFAKRDAERKREACETLIADYQARCVRGKSPYYQSLECAEFQADIRARCDAEKR